MSTSIKFECLVLRAGLSSSRPLSTAVSSTKAVIIDALCRLLLGFDECSRSARYMSFGRGFSAANLRLLLGPLERCIGLEPEFGAGVVEAIEVAGRDFVETWSAASFEVVFLEVLATCFSLRGEDGAIISESSCRLLLRLLCSLFTRGVVFLFAGFLVIATELALSDLEEVERVRGRTCRSGRGEPGSSSEESWITIVSPSVIVLVSSVALVPACFRVSMFSTLFSLPLSILRLFGGGSVGWLSMRGCLCSYGDLTGSLARPIAPWVPESSSLMDLGLI